MGDLILYNDSRIKLCHVISWSGAVQGAVLGEEIVGLVECDALAFDDPLVDEVHLERKDR